MTMSAEYLNELAERKVFVWVLQQRLQRLLPEEKYQLNIGQPVWVDDKARWEIPTEIIFPGFSLNKTVHVYLRPCVNLQ